jgi:alpha-tubulin suppressor-like RCC1 family protein
MEEPAEPAVVRDAGVAEAEVEPAGVLEGAPELPVSAAHPGALRVAAGLMHSCAATGGRVHCWGYNGHGELGDGTRGDRRAPTAVVGLTDAKVVVTGNWHSCALRAGGTVMCWGDATHGQVGDGQVGSRLRPVVVPGLAGVTEIAARGSQTCTLGQGGVVACWGERYGAVDDEQGSARPRVVAGVKASAIAVGEGYACAVQRGRAWCWGRVPLPAGMNFAATPIVVPGVSGVVEVAAGDRHACARRRGGTVLCWGEGREGQRGDGVRDAAPPRWPGHHPPPHREVVERGPAAVVGLSDVVRVAAGSDFSCALRKGGDVVCWGEDRDGQLGDGGSEAQARPVAVQIGPVADLSLGAAHACAALRDGTMWCWGYNEAGQADNAATLRRRAAYVAFAGEAKAPLTGVAAAGRHACAVAGGRVVCLGDNTFGQLGDGGRVTPAGPVFVGGISDAVEVVVGLRHSCARRRGGEVQCWGDDTFGQLGQPGEPVGEPRDEHGMGPAPAPVETRSRPTPVTVAGLGAVTQLVARGHATCGLGAAGRLRCWHGDGAEALRDEVALPRDTREVGLGAVHSCARRETGEVLCWGLNLYGRIGDGTRVDRPQPTLVKGLSDATALATGLLHSCALRRGGEVVCWGSGSAGRLGDGSEEERDVIVTVEGLKDAVAIAAGEDHTCALRRGGEGGGEVVCWGSNSEGALGDGTTSTRLVPVPVVGVPRARSIAAGEQLSCAVAASGEAVHCWGRELKALDATRVWDVARRPVAVRGLP